jgi:hypothetical protein
MITYTISSSKLGPNIRPFCHTQACLSGGRKGLLKHLPAALFDYLDVGLVLRRRKVNGKARDNDLHCSKMLQDF